MNLFFEKKYLFVLSMWKLTLGYGIQTQLKEDFSNIWLSRNIFDEKEDSIRQNVIVQWYFMNLNQ
jgi:hypothetical protein